MGYINTDYFLWTIIIYILNMYLMNAILLKKNNIYIYIIKWIIE